MASKTDIFNGAFRLVGATAVTDSADDVVQANVANDLYTELLEDMLAGSLWNFAIKSVQLTDSGDTPTAGYDYAFDFPSDWLRTIRISNDDAFASVIEFGEEIVNSTRTLVTDVDTVYMRYVSQVTDTTTFSPAFTRALIYALARDLAIPLANSNTLEEQLAKKADRALARARSIDSLQTTPQQRPRGSWADSRGGRRWFVK